MFEIIKGQRGLLILGLILALLTAVANFLLMFLSGWLIASAAAAGVGGVVLQNAFNMTLPATGVRFLAITRIVSRYLERIVNHDIALRAIGSLRSWSFRKLIPHSVLLARFTRSGDFLNRFVNDTEKMGQVFLEVLTPIFTAIGGSILAVLILAYFLPEGGMILAVGLFIAGGIVPLITQKLISQPTRKVAQYNETLQGEIVETIHALEDITVCGDVQEHLKQLLTTQDDIDGASKAEFLRANTMRQTITMIALATTVAVALAAAHAFKVHTLLDSPQIAMLALGALASFEFITPLVDVQLNRERYLRSKERVLEVCNMETSNNELSSHNTDHAPGAVPLEIKDLSLNTPEGHPIFSHLNLKVRAGERVAILGASGAGKTSLGRVLTGLIAPTSGEVLIYGQPLALGNDTHPDCGMLVQDYHLFSGSIRDNLKIADPKASDDKLWEALKNVDLDTEVKDMPEQLDTAIGERGVRLSGGQARRLAAAQIILQQPKILVLDEPTESLSAKQGTLLIKSITDCLPITAIVCITHRKEPLSFMDCVYELDKGQLNSLGREALNTSV